MARRTLLAALGLVALACSPNVVSSGIDAGQDQSGGDDGGTTIPSDYPPPPYGVTVHKVIQDFTLPGYFTAGSGTKVNTLPFMDGFDLEQVRHAAGPNGQPLKYMLLDISAGWCPPCNEEAQQLGLQGAEKGKIDEWLSKGGILVTVLVEGHDESTHAAPVQADIEQWINDHAVQSTVVFDPSQALIAQGINPSAFPTNLVIDLSTMKIVSAWYGLDPTYQKWEAALGAQ